MQNHVINKYFKCYVKGDIHYRKKMTFFAKQRESGM